MMRQDPLNFKPSKDEGRGFDFRILPLLIFLNLVFLANILLHVNGTLYYDVFDLADVEEIVVQDARRMGGLTNSPPHTLERALPGTTLSGTTDKQALLGAEFILTLKVFVCLAVIVYIIAWVREILYRSSTGHARITNPVLSNGLLGFIAANFVVVFFIVSDATFIGNTTPFVSYFPLDSGTLRNIGPTIFTLISLNFSFFLLFNPSAYPAQSSRT